MSVESDNIKGKIFNIQHFSVDDGPGIRTTVFLKGCPLTCAWCHNPESQRAEAELIYRANRCHGCGRCVEACENAAHAFRGGVHYLNRESCVVCGKCVDVCPFDALETVGKETNVAEVLSELLRDDVFYGSSGGGITLSGGEPTAQLKFIVTLLETCKNKNLHTAIETCGYCSKKALRAVAKHTDLFLFDYKLTSNTLHKKYTGVSNRSILENLQELNNLGAHIVLRCPMIPDINMSEEHFAGIARLVCETERIQEVQLLPYHSMGIEKALALDKKFFYKREEFLATDELSKIAEFIQRRVSIPVRVLA